MNLRGIWSIAIGTLLLFSGLFLASAVVVLFAVVTLAVGIYILTRKSGVPRSKLVFNDMTPVQNAPQTSAQLAPSKFCRHCGHRLPVRALYCSQCGSPQ